MPSRVGDYQKLDTLLSEYLYTYNTYNNIYTYIKRTTVDLDATDVNKCCLEQCAW